METLNNIREALNTAQQTARCLLTNDPFKAWEKVVEQTEEWDPFSDTSTPRKQDSKTTVKATANVKKLITQQMRQQVIDAQKRLDKFASCLWEFLDDVAKLKSLGMAIQLAEGLQCDEPLETAEARKKREEAEQDLD